MGGGEAALKGTRIKKGASLKSRPNNRKTNFLKQLKQQRRKLRVRRKTLDEKRQKWGKGEEIQIASRYNAGGKDGVCGGEKNKWGRKKTRIRRGSAKKKS